MADRNDGIMGTEGGDGIAVSTIGASIGGMVAGLLLLLRVTRCSILIADLDKYPSSELLSSRRRLIGHRDRPSLHAARSFSLPSSFKHRGYNMYEKIWWVLVFDLMNNLNRDCRREAI